MSKDDIKVTREITVVNALGLHTRPSMRLVDICSRFESDVIIEYAGVSIDAKNIMQVNMMSATWGTKLVFHACGPDASELLDAVEKLLTEDLPSEDSLD